MARAARPRRYTERLPPIQVTPEMYALLREQVTLRDRSMADLVREALDLTAAIPTELLTALEAASARLEVPVADLISEALAEYQNKNWGVW